MSTRPICAYNFTGRTQRLDGKEIKIEEQLTEVLDRRMGQRQVLTLARYVETNQPVMLKIRYELNPADFGIENVEENREITENHFGHEMHALETVGNIGHGPQYIDHFTRDQCEGMPYPEGIVDYLIMTRVPGENVDEIYEDLSDDQLRSIKRQLVYIMETMRQTGKLFSTQHPSSLRYDRTADKLYLIDFTFFTFVDKKGTRPINEYDMFVLAFNVWRRPSLENPPPARPLQENIRPESQKPRGAAPGRRGDRSKENQRPGNQRPPWR